MRRATLLLAPVLASALLLGACADGSSAPGATTGETGTATLAVTAPGPASATTSVVATATGPTQTPLPTEAIQVDQTIKDPDLGHQIEVVKIIRNLPWPEGYKASAEAYELVAVEMKWTPGTTYTAPIRLQDFSIDTGSQFPNRPDALVNPVLQAASWPLLPAEVPNGESAQGYAVFKVDPKGAPKMVLTYTRPKSQVSDSGKIFPSEAFTAPLVG